MGQNGLSAGSTLSSILERVASIDATPGLAEANPISHVEALDHIPEQPLIIGGGYRLIVVPLPLPMIGPLNSASRLKL
jgi:hypothetical protein